jgi:hypothetical protein
MHHEFLELLLAVDLQVPNLAEEVETEPAVEAVEA